MKTRRESKKIEIQKRRAGSNAQGPSRSAVFTNLRPRSAYDVMAALSLFIVLGGTSYAVATNSIGSAQIKNNSVQSKDIRNGQVSTVDVRDRSLAAVDFMAGQLPAGQTGAQGAPGARGATGAAGPAGAVGPQGARGDAGAQGPKGDPCPTSDLLCHGPKGDAGATGAKGDTGATGAKGDTGAAGPQGIPGVSGYEIVISDAVTHSSDAQGFGVASCPTGKKVLGGGVVGSNAAHHVGGSAPMPGGTTWGAWMNNTAAVSLSFRVYAVCAVVVD